MGEVEPESWTSREDEVTGTGTGTGTDTSTDTERVTADANNTVDGM